MPDEERIRRRAHEIWEREGQPDGQHEDHWARACRELEAESADAEGVIPPSGLDQDPPPPPQIPMDVLGNQVGSDDTDHLSGAAGTTLSQGSGMAGGNADPPGGQGSAAIRPGTGVSVNDGPPRSGPARLPADGAGPEIADPDSAQGQSPAKRGRSTTRGTSNRRR